MIVLALGIALALLTPPLAETDRAEQAYLAGRYGEAYRLYEAALNQSAVPHGPVHYNLGNCAYRMGRHAEAVLQFSRAQKRMPRDEAVRFNRALAEQALGIETPPYESFGDAAASLADAFTPGEMLAIVGILQTAGLVGLVIFRRQRAVRNLMLLLMVIALMGAARLVQLRWFPASPGGIVLQEEIVVRTEPHADRGVIFELKAGQSLRVEESSDRWIRVTHARGRGWTERAGVGIVD